MIVVRALLPYALCLVVVVCIALAGAGAFVGWPLNATEVEFLLVPGILKNSAAFAGTTYLSLAENLNALSLMPTMVSFFQGFGVSPERLQVYLRAAQNLFMCAGVVAMMLALRGTRRPWLVLLGFLLVVASGKHHFYYFKIVASTFVSGLLILGIAAGLARRMWLAAAVLVLVGAVHPTYFVLAACGIAIVYWFGDGSPWRRLDRQRLMGLLPLAVASVPIVIVWLFNISAILQPAVDKEFWFAYMFLRSDLAFPLRQGYTVVLGMFVPLILAVLVFRREGRTTGDGRYAGLAALAAFCVSLVAVQILGSELGSTTITRLALSHRLQFSFDILFFASLVWIALRRYMDSGLLSWLAIPLFSVLIPTTPLLAQFGLTDRGTLFLAVLALQTVQDAGGPHSPKRMFVVAGTWALALLPMTFYWSPRSYVIWAVVGVSVEMLVRKQWAGVASASVFLRPVSVAALLIAAANIAFEKMPLPAATEDLRAFRHEQTPRLTHERWQTRIDYADFIKFVTDTVPPEDAIMSVPYYIGQSFTPIPYRATYLDWGESNYVLYVGGKLDDVVQRLGTYGIAITKRPEGCTVWAMFMAKPDSDEARCARLSFQRQSWGSKREWRNHIPTIQSLSPNTRWVLIHRVLVCSGERPVAVWKDFALIRLGDAIPRPGCVNPEA